MNPSPMLLDAAVMLALNSGDYSQTQQAIRILDHNSGFYEGVRASAIETAARILAKELARYQAMRPRIALELSESNDRLNEELAEVKRDRDGWKKADVLARIRIGELERERDEAREQSGLKLAACECAAIMDTAETHAQNKTVTRDNPSWSPAFESVMRRTAECIQLRADNARLRSEIAVQQQTINALSGDSYPTHLELVIRDNTRLREALFKEELNRNQLAVLGSDNARLRELLRVAHCPNCGGVGYTVGADKYGEPVQIQCEWCFKQSAALMQPGGAP